MRIKRRKAYGSWRQDAHAKNGRAKVQASIEKRSWRCEIVGLLRLRENVWDVVPLVAPCVQVHWREKDSISAMENQAFTWKVLGNSQTRRKVVFVREHQPLGVTDLAPDDTTR